MAVTPKTLKISAIWLIVLMMLTFIMPPGLHIDFCFGEEGHFDISLHLCPDEASSLKTIKSESLFNHSIHEDCTNHISDCNPICELLCRDGGVRIINPSVKKQILHLNRLKHSISKDVLNLCSTFSDKTSFLVSDRNIPPFHLSHLNTIVLLN